MEPSSIQRRRVIGIWCELAVLTGCCVFTSCGAATPSVSPQKDIGQSISGIWAGTHTSSVGGTVPALGIVTEKNEVFFTADNGNSGNFFGTLSASGSNLSGSLTEFVSGSTHTVSATGTIRQKQAMSITYTGSTESGNLSLNYNPVYERASSFAQIAGPWVLSGGGGLADFTVNSSGVVSASNLGCQLTGNFSLIEPSFNAYKLTVTISTCPLVEGTFQGLAMLSDTSSPNDTFTLFLNDGAKAIALKFTK